VDLAMAIPGRPELLFPDDPSTGLDPESRRGTWMLISGLPATGTTVVLTTRYLEEAEHIADHHHAPGPHRPRRHARAGHGRAAGPRYLPAPGRHARGSSRDHRGPGQRDRVRVLPGTQDLQPALTALLARAGARNLPLAAQDTAWGV
jgi:ABC-2 type transport system ATP-binding protein